MEYPNFETLVGETITKWEGGEGDELVTITTLSGRKFQMYHRQDCCEQVWLNDIDGNIQDIVGQTVTHASEDSCESPTASESGTWTFYRIGTERDFFVIRWIGESNGYYSEGVSFVEIK